VSYRAIYAYAWDIAEVGVQPFVAEAKALGLDTITFAGSYHAGKFIRPKGKAGKVYFPEDGTIYFRPERALDGVIKPQQASVVTKQFDILRDLCGAGISVNAWMVLLHNTRLGTLHPGATVENAFGDRYVYSLCPSHPNVRKYAVALCKDVTDNYPVVGVSLETPGFLPYQHGFHHEFALMKQNRWFDALLGLCFCKHCIAGARAAGVDAARLRARVRDDIERYLSSDVDFSDDMAEAFWLADVQASGELSGFLRFRCGVVTSLIRDVRAAVRSDAAIAVIPSVARPTGGAWYEGTDVAGLANAGNIIEACFYEPSVARIRADIFDVKRRVGEGARLRGILRPAYPDLQSKADLAGAATALREAGVEGIAFYNYGHLRRQSIAWIADALAAFGG
jgi:hypothetical protein